MLSTNFMVALAAMLIFFLSVESRSLEKRAFALRQYADFQISDGKAGKAQEAASAVFVDPFKSVDLANVSPADLQNVETMARAAVNAEASFNKAMAAAPDAATKAALNAGKIVNKVLKLTGEIQVLKIQAAKGLNVATNMKIEQKKLTENLKRDAAQVGVPMKSFLSI